MGEACLDVSRTCSEILFEVDRQVKGRFVNPEDIVIFVTTPLYQKLALSVYGLNRVDVDRALLSGYPVRAVYGGVDEWFVSVAHGKANLTH